MFHNIYYMPRLRVRMSNDGPLVAFPSAFHAEQALYRQCEEADRSLAQAIGEYWQLKVEYDTLPKKIPNHRNIKKRAYWKAHQALKRSYEANLWRLTAYHWLYQFFLSTYYAPSSSYHDPNHPWPSPPPYCGTLDPKNPPHGWLGNGTLNPRFSDPHRMPGWHQDLLQRRPPMAWQTPPSDAWQAVPSTSFAEHQPAQWPVDSYDQQRGRQPPVDSERYSLHQPAVQAGEASHQSSPRMSSRRRGKQVARESTAEAQSSSTSPSSIPLPRLVSTPSTRSCTVSPPTPRTISLYDVPRELAGWLLTPGVDYEPYEPYVPPQDAYCWADDSCRDTLSSPPVDRVAALGTYRWCPDYERLAAEQAQHKLRKPLQAKSKRLLTVIQANEAAHTQRTDTIDWEMEQLRRPRPGALRRSDSMTRLEDQHKKEADHEANEIARKAAEARGTWRLCRL